MRHHVSVLLVGCLFLLCAALPGRVAAHPPLNQQDTSAVVNLYYRIINAGFLSGDFSALAAVYAPDATLVRSTPQGETFALHGLQQIIPYYHRLFQGDPDVQFVRDHWYLLSPTILLNYEHITSRAFRSGARCSHLFVIQNGHIQQLFWVAYFAGMR